MRIPGLAITIVFATLPMAQARELHVDQNHAEADDANPGTNQKPLQTISAAAAVAEPGDTVLIGAGTYREYVSPNTGGTAPDKMITYRAREGERVVIKGSDVWKPAWKRAQIEGVSRDVWEAPLDPDLFTFDFPAENFNPFVQSPLKIYSQTAEEYYAPVRPPVEGESLEITRGAIFLDGRPLNQITDPRQFDYAGNLFFVPPDGARVLVRLGGDRSPEGLQFEFVTREQCFAPRVLGRHFIHLKDLHFEHAANGNGVPQFGMVSSSRGRFWILEGCSFRWAGTAGADIGDQCWWRSPPGRSYDNQAQNGELDFQMIVRRCTFADNGTAGLWCYGSRSILVEDCVFERNNRLGRNTWEEAGIKCHGVKNSVFRNNLFRDNDSYGLWLDGPAANNRITQNLFISNMNSGVFIESSLTTQLIDNNISFDSLPFTFYQITKADGFYTHQSSNVIHAHNLAFGNAGYGIRCVVLSKNKAGGWGGLYAKVSHNRVLNNIVYANGRAAIGLPVDDFLAWDNQSRGNLFWGAADAPLFELQRGVVAPSKLVAAIRKSMADHDISPHEAPLLNRWAADQLGPNVGDMRHNGPLVGLGLWQAVQDFDKDAVVGALPDLRMYRDGRMVIKLKRPDKPIGKNSGDGDEVVGARPQSYALLSDVSCEPLTYIKYDYFGHERPDGTPHTVGPIQSLEKLADNDIATTLELWPNAHPDRPPAPEMRIEMKALSVVGEGEKEPE